MKNILCRFLTLALLAASLTFSSCAGVSMDIQMNRDGSSRLTLEYRLFRMLENLGKLDGNESMPTLPIGKTDWQRTADRIQGMKLVSFSVKDEKKDFVYKVTLDFDNEKSLLQFLDPSSQRAVINRQNQSGVFDILLLDKPPVYDSDMMDLIAFLSQDYNFSVSFSSPSNSTLILKDANGNPLSASNAKIIPTGKKVSFSTGIMDIFELKDGLRIIFNW